DINSLEAQRSRVIPNANNQLPQNGQLAVEITDSAKLGGGSYTIQFSGDGRSFEVTDNLTGESLSQGRLPDPVQSEISLPGFNIRVEGGTFNAGDKYLIQPTRSAAENIGLEVSREEDLAFASPIRAAAGDQNIGTGEIDQGTMLNVRNPFTNSLLPGFQSAGELANGPLTVTFASGGPTGLTFTVTDAGGTAIGAANQPYTAGQANELFTDDPAAGAAYQGFQFRVTGEPAPGDTFSIDYNSNGVSDNRNAELLAALGTANTMNNGTQNFTEGYAGLVEDIGVKTRQSQLDMDASKTLLEQSTAQRESVSGVNLDEEAGKLIQYQAAYNASAQVMSVAQDLFDTLLGTFR
ncbi:MAG: flagellar hook-associated protein FlgK, partial [Gammaproteobacteria bacterium]